MCTEYRNGSTYSRLCGVLQLRIAMNFNIPTYENWVTERNLMEERTCAEMQTIEPDQQSLFSILKCDRLDVPTLLFCRPPCQALRLTPTRRKVKSMAICAEVIIETISYLHNICSRHVNFFDLSNEGWV